MRKLLNSQLISTALAIFSMLFGAGNLYYPIMVGLHSGSNTFFGMIGFLLAAVVLPVLGLVAMILFDGDYELFFERLGKIAGKLCILVCMIVIGPLIAIPRIATLSHEMVKPFMPFAVSDFTFSFVFLALTFICTYKENSIVNLLGRVISPLLLLSLAIIIGVGFATGTMIVPTTSTPLSAFTSSFVRGYGTLDLLGGIFFSAIVLTILKNTTPVEQRNNVRALAVLGLKAGVIGAGILGLVYIGMSFLGMYHGHGLLALNGGEVFREVSARVLGKYGTLVVATAVLMACLSTAIALFAVVGDYFQKHVCHNAITFPVALLIVWALCMPLSSFGLGAVMKVADGPLTLIGYPILIGLTLCNIAYKLWGFKPIKVPVALIALTGIVTVVMNSL